MKTIIATIKPQHLSNIRGGAKKEEIRKTIPRCDLPVRVLCCESASGGKIKCEFILDSYRTSTLEKLYKPYDPTLPWETVGQTCVRYDDLVAYMCNKQKQTIYFWHISNMIDYCSTKGYRLRNIAEFGLNRPPQSWCYVEEE